MTREEAINKVRQMSLSREIMDILEALAPELKKSDEEIRKQLIGFISDVKRISESGRSSWAVRKGDVEMCNAFLAYLEKQKEYKPEWDVEDKLMIKCCLRALKHYKYTGKPNQFVPARFDIGGYLATVETVENWLKSLCPQPHWRPNEKQKSNERD